MRKISIDEAIGKIAAYTDKLAKEGKLEPKKDEFSIVLPLEKHQALIFSVDNTDEGRQAHYTINDQVFIMKKLKNIGLNIFGEDTNE